MPSDPASVQGVGTLRSFSYDALPGRVRFGDGASKELAAELDLLGVRRALVIASERELARVGELIQSIAGRAAGVFSGVEPHVPLEVAVRARRAARDVGADGLLSIGGGSATGTAKAVALELALPILAVPTTYSGSEMTPIWGLTEDRRKTTGRSAQVQPRTVIYDPGLTLSLPPSIMGPSAVNAIAHCVDALHAPAASPITDLLAEQGIVSLARALPGAVAAPDDREARSELLYGTYLAGAAFAVTGSALHHKLCHVLGGAYGLPHAQLHTVLLPHVVAVNAAARPDVAARIADALCAADAAAGIRTLIERIGAPTSLREIGMRERDLPEATELCVQAAPAGHLPPFDRTAARRLLRDAYEGRSPRAPVSRTRDRSS